MGHRTETLQTSAFLVRRRGLGRLHRARSQAREDVSGCDCHARIDQNHGQWRQIDGLGKNLPNPAHDPRTRI
jgi:hypothetical protein